MNRKFKPGKRLMKMKNLAIVACLIVVFVFYFIYRYLFEATFPQFVGLPMVILFILFGALVYKGVTYFYKKYADGTYYIVTDDALVVGVGKSEKKYAWNRFKKAGLSLNAVRAVCPVVFQIGDEELKLNQYVEDIYELVGRILSRIEPYAEIEEELKQRTQTMKGIY